MASCTVKPARMPVWVGVRCRRNHPLDGICEAMQRGSEMAVAAARYKVTNYLGQWNAETVRS